MRHSVVRDIPPAVPCKICGATCAILGSVDFNRSCEKTRIDSPSGILIPYHRCRVCKLVFTVAFDGFSREDFAREIYNEDYPEVDPDYVETRPAGNAQLLIDGCSESKRSRILDYGGGNGALADKLRAAGFENVTTYDPFVAEFSARPAGKFELVTCFEVVEHSPTPRETFADINSFVTDDGAIYLSTLIQPPDFDRQGMDWWYIGPRNGHVTIYSGDALTRVSLEMKYNFASSGEAHHLMFRKIPDFARQWFGTS